MIGWSLRFVYTAKVYAATFPWDMLRLIRSNQTPAILMASAMKHGHFSHCRKPLAISHVIQEIGVDCGCDAVVRSVLNRLQL